MLWGSEVEIISAWKIFEQNSFNFFTKDKKSEYGKNHEKRCLQNLYQNRSKKNIENSEIGPDS